MNKVKDFFRFPLSKNIEDYHAPAGMAVIAVFYIASFLIVTYAYNMPQTMIIVFIEQLLFLALLGFLFRKVLLENLKLFKANLAKYIPNIIIWFVIVFMANTAGGNITKLLMNNLNIMPEVTNESAVSSAVSQFPILGFLAVVLTGPFIEELVFRKSSKLIFKNKFFYYFMSAFLFGAGHIMIGFTFPASLVQIIPYFCMGLALAAVYDRSNNIWCSIIPHAISNAVTFILPEVLAAS